MPECWCFRSDLWWATCGKSEVSTNDEKIRITQQWHSHQRSSVASVMPVDIRTIIHHCRVRSAWGVSPGSMKSTLSFRRPDNKCVQGPACIGECYCLSPAAKQDHPKIVLKAANLQSKDGFEDLVGVCGQAEKFGRQTRVDRNSAYVGPDADLPRPPSFHRHWRRVASAGPVLGGA